MLFQVKRQSVNNSFEDIANEIWGLYFDGKKDKTLINKKNKTCTNHPRVILQEHITLVKEVGSSYLTHVSPEKSTAVAVSDCIYEKLTEMGVSFENLKAVGSDGTVVNTGPTGGIITLLEKKLEKPLQWFICLLHFNELPFRHLIEKLFKPAAGPLVFCGELTKQLQTCEDLPVVPDYERIKINFPEIDSGNLSSDQKYLLEIAQAVSNGKCSKRLATKKPGKKNLKVSFMILFHVL